MLSIISSRASWAVAPVKGGELPSRTRVLHGWLKQGVGSDLSQNGYGSSSSSCTLPFPPHRERPWRFGPAVFHKRPTERLHLLRLLILPVLDRQAVVTCVGDTNLGLFSGRP